MTTYNLFTTTPSIASAGTGTLNLSVEFYVTSAANLTELRFLQPSSGADFGQRDLGLWDLVSGTMVVTTSVTPGGGSSGTWVVATLGTPYALVVNRRYRAICHYEGSGSSFAATPDYFSSGAGSSGVTNGILVAPNQSGATGNLQGGYSAGGSLGNVDNSLGTNYWTDVTVATAGATTFSRPIQRRPNRGLIMRGRR